MRQRLPDERENQKGDESLARKSQDRDRLAVTLSHRECTLTRSRGIDDLLVRHLFVEARLHRALHHVGDGLAGGRLPGRLDHHLQAVAFQCGRQNARRKLERLVGNLVSFRRIRFS